VQPCEDHPCGFLYEWQLFSKLYGNESYVFNDGNATITVFNAKWMVALYLSHLRHLSYPELIQEPPFTMPSESFCLNEVGVESTISCQNPANISSVRESGLYCNNPHTLTSYHVYSIVEFHQDWTMNLNLTVAVDAGNVTYPFECDSMTRMCYYRGNGTLPEMAQFRYLFDGWLWTMGETDFYDTFLIIPSPSRLYPYTPLPDDAFMYPAINMPLEAAQIPKPDCFRWEGQLAQFNTSTEYFPEYRRLGLIEDYGVNPESVKLTMEPLRPLILSFELTRPGNYIWLEATTLIPHRNDTRFVP
jgi:hypothetical protein